MPEAITRRSATPPEQAVIALALGKSHLQGALISATGRVLTQQAVPLAATTVRAAVATITQFILALAAAPERGKIHLKAVGISVDGVIDHQAQRVSFAHQSGFNWERVPLRTMIEAALDEAGVDIRVPVAASPRRAAEMTAAHPVLVVNATRDAVVAGEAWCGAAAGKNNVVTLIFGQEITAGFLLAGKVFHGAGDLAGAASWIAISENWRGDFGGVGALATIISEAALVRRLLERWTPDANSLLSKVALADPAQLSAATIIRAARSDDPLARSVVEETCTTIGRAAANVISLLNPEAVVIGGTFGLQLKPFLPHIKAEAKRWAAPAPYQQAQIFMAKLGENAALFGAAKLAWQQAG